MADYIQDARQVEPIASYENTDDDFEQFSADLYDHAEEPKTLPDDFDWDDDDPRDFDRVRDGEAAEDRARDWFKFAFGYANHGRGVDRANLVVFNLPGWFAQDELGDWTEWWFGTLDVAKRDDGGEWTAMCLSDIEPMSDRGEDSYFRNPIEESWLPLSLVEFAFSVHRVRSEDHLVLERGLDSDEIVAERGMKDDADVVVEHVDRHAQYGPKLVLDSPYEVKDDIQALDWDQFHPDWDGDNWRVDAGALWPFVEALTMQGWSICVAERVENECSHDALNNENAPYIPIEVCDV